MILGNVIAELRLGYRTQVATSSATGHVAVCSPQGHAIVLDSKLQEVAGFPLSGKPDYFALSPDATMLAVVLKDSLQVYAKDQSVMIVPGQFACCAFNADASVLCTSRQDGESVFAEYRDPHSLRGLAAATVDDPFGDSDTMVFHHPDPSLFCLWIAAGQDGQILVTLRQRGDVLEATRLTDLVETTPPTFAASGRTFLVAQPDRVIHYSFPAGEKLAEFNWEDEEDSLAEHLHFAGENRAIINTTEGRMLMLDVPGLTLLDEFAVAGHEPRPIRDCYPSLSSEEGIGTDLQSFQPCGKNSFVSTHSVAGQTPSTSTDLLVVWKPS